jgi:nitrogen fixation-related uncharacterized protein
MADLPIPAPPVKLVPIVAAICIVVIAGAYCVFLYATWGQYQDDRKHKATALDELLDRLPPKKPEPAPESE